MAVLLCVSIKLPGYTHVLSQTRMNGSAKLYFIRWTKAIVKLQKMTTECECLSLLNKFFYASKVSCD